MGCTALILAAHRGHRDIVEILLDRFVSTVMIDYVSFVVLWRG